ncbi:ribonuclease H-like domain-containing protein [Tanacetum coccineum]
MDETNNTHPKGTVPNETDFINDFYEHSELNSDVEELPANTVRSIEPTCYEEVVLDSNWIDVMNAEIEALNENQTWVIVDLPTNRKAIGNKWIYKIKYKSSGDIDRCKARLVVKGFNQKEGIDFDENFSLVVKMSTVRCIIALSVTSNWPLFQLDSANDHSLFTKSKNNKFIALLVYVDDIVVTGNCVDENDKFKSFLKFKFKIKDLGHLKYFLGIEVIKSDKDLCLSQRKYCLDLLKDYGLLRCKPVSTPMVPNSVLPYEPTEDDPLLDNITGYQKLLGKLINLTHIRPDIAYSVHCLAQYMHSPLKSHLSCALNVLRYLKGAPGKGIRYKYPNIKDTICGYHDADWAKCLKTRKSVTGYCVVTVMSSSPHSTIVPSDYDTEDAFSSMNILNYFPASPGNISPNSSNDFTKYLLDILFFLPLHDNPMPPKRSSTSATPTMNQDAIRQLIADIAEALEAQCAEEDRVTFATGTLTNDALSWWNAYTQPIGIEQANRITWTKLKRLLTNKYCPRTEVKKMEDEFYNLVVKGNDLKTYIRRFRIRVLFLHGAKFENLWKLSSEDCPKALKKSYDFKTLRLWRKPPI